MEKIKVKAVNISNNPLPEYKTPLSAGADLRAFVNGSGTKMVSEAFVQGDKIVIWPMGRCKIDTGLHIQLPDGYEAQVRPRSGLTLQNGIICILGTVDADYTGSIGIIIINLSKDKFVINDGDRIAQLVIKRVEQAEFELVDKLDETERGNNGFGHTGTK